MKILQWSMTIPINKEPAFIKWFEETAGPTFEGFGAKKHELYKVENKQVVGRQTLEKNRFVERVYFEDNFDLPDYFAKVKNNPEAHKLSRSYEEVFGATNIELRILVSP